MSNHINLKITPQQLNHFKRVMEDDLAKRLNSIRSIPGNNEALARKIALYTETKELYDLLLASSGEISSTDIESDPFG